MSDAIHWVLELGIKDGSHDDLIALMTEMATATKADEPDCTHYEWYVSADKTTCHIYERYADSAATMTHLGNFGAKFADRFMAILTPSRLTVYGDASDEVRNALAGLGAVHMAQIGGFAR